MTMDWLELLSQMACGACAAAGFGILFNIGWRSLGWCLITGALALGVRGAALALGMNLEGASFLAALVVGTVVQLLRYRSVCSHNAFDVAGCIPMVPGSFAAKAILSLFALTLTEPDDAGTTLLVAVEFTLRVVLTVGAIATGLAIPSLAVRGRKDGVTGTRAR